MSFLDSLLAQMSAMNNTQASLSSGGEGYESANPLTSYVISFDNRKWYDAWKDKQGRWYWRYGIIGKGSRIITNKRFYARRTQPNPLWSTYG